ncbi:S24 family peptidase [Sphingobium sp. DEHP117]|uniref:S24 family peptidase n=1 Tax=Sphingobium sp. DEHP117 TaxID=2993436 RepID=UPI0027D6DB99|nr:S24 family peptidase [Sphingobium sp. DEHP117]MDQ4418904.1 S24 family peptidase [Sphingobium sp. DEHP117]
MDENAPREFLAKLIADRGENYGSLSRLLGRNAAYIQQFIKRGTPRKLDEEDRRLLARYFGVDEMMLGAPGPGAPPHMLSDQRQESKIFPKLESVVAIPRLLVEASAGHGALADDEEKVATIGFDRHWLKQLGLSPETVSIIDVKGESMSPTLVDGDTIMVDRADGAERLRDGIYVLRLDDALMVKRVALSPQRGVAALTVSSDNRHYPTWQDVDPALVDIVGRVVWSCRRLI